MVAIRKCSRCGKQGHNKQTCGRAPTQPSPVLPASAIPPGEGKTQTVPSTAARTVDEVWKQMHPGGETDGKAVDAETFTVDEFDTWWHLTSSGRDGKAGKGKSLYDRKNPLWTDADTEKLFSLLVEAAKSSSVRPVEAKKFLSQFGAEAKLRLAHKEKLPLVFLVALAKDSSLYVRGAIAQRPDTPGEVLAMMMRTEKDPDIAAVAARNPNTFAETLEDMFHKRATYVHRGSWSSSKKTEGYVANTLLQNPNLPADCVMEGYRSRAHTTFCASLVNGHIPADLLERQWKRSYTLSGITDAGKGGDMREMIIQNPNCPEHIMLGAIDDPNCQGYVVVNMWLNPSLSDEVVRRAWNSETAGGERRPRHDVLERIGKNQNVPQWVVDDALEKGWVSGWLKKIFENHGSRKGGGNGEVK